MVLRLRGVSVHQLFLVSNTSTEVFLSVSTLLMKKIASPSMCPPPLLHLLPPAPPPSSVPMWVVTGNNWKEDREQQLLSEEKTNTDFRAVGSKNKPVGGDLTGAGRAHKHESRKCRAPLTKVQLFRTLQDI